MFKHVGGDLLPFINLLEQVLEPPVVFLQDSVLGGHVQWEALAKCHLEGGMCETSD